MWKLITKWPSVKYLSCNKWSFYSVAIFMFCDATPLCLLQKKLLQGGEEKKRTLKMALEVWIAPFHRLSPLPLHVPLPPLVAPCVQSNRSRFNGYLFYSFCYQLLLLICLSCRLAQTLCLGCYWLACTRECASSTIDL